MSRIKRVIGTEFNYRNQDCWESKVNRDITISMFKSTIPSIEDFMIHTAVAQEAGVVLLTYERRGGSMSFDEWIVSYIRDRASDLLGNLDPFDERARTTRDKVRSAFWAPIIIDVVRSTETN